ncbi:MAG: PilC/PilY family type IV pilus protein [Pseudomonadota bacterium]
MGAQVTRAGIIGKTLAVAAGLSLGAGAALADDAELYQTAGYEFGPDYYANVLFIIDTSGSMNSWVDGDGTTRLDVVQDVAEQFFNDLEYVNVGMMRFDSGYTDPDTFWYIQGGGMVTNAVKDIAVSRDELITNLNNFIADGTTPLSETLFEAAHYMMGWDVYFGNTTYAGLGWWFPDPDFLSPSVPESRDGDTYISPIKECQENHIVILTDGLPVFDFDIDDVVTDWPGFPAECTDNPDVSNGDCLDDIAAYLYENDLYGNETDGFQNIKVHTIGFFQDNSLLEETAERGGGGYYLADDAESLLNVLESIFIDVNETGTTFTSPGVSVNAFDRTTHLDQLYYSVFQATGRTRWVGNLKRYRLGEDTGGGLVVVDADGQPAVEEANGFFREDSRSWWGDEIDGYSVSAGGAATHLTADRNVFTEFGGAVTAMNVDNTELLEYLNQLYPDDDLEDAIEAGMERVIERGGQGLELEDKKQQIEILVDWAVGNDLQDEDNDLELYDARQEMGDPMHSRPLVVTYADGDVEPEAVVFVGTNEGFLHALKGETGEEISSFMPFELLPKLPDWFANAETADRTYGVDGPITAWVRDGGDGEINPGDQVILYFGLRRGGNYYYALDYTDPVAPRLLWKLSGTSPGMAQLGQSWSPFVRTKVETGSFGNSLVQDVLIFGGGYDERHDNYSAWSADSEGNAIYMINAFTGELVWSGSAANTQDTTKETYFADMNNAITGTIRTLDLDNDGLVDRMYAADLGGRVWRLDVHNPREEGDEFKVTGGVMASVGGVESAQPFDNRRFYYAPDLALGAANGSNFFNLTIASGYRAHPKDGTIKDYFYVLRDYYPFLELGNSDDPAAEYVSRYGFTHDTLSEISVLQNDPNALVSGFKLPLVTAAGEKVLAQTRIFQNNALFTSYLPQNELTRGCFAALGSGQLYSVDLSTGGVNVDALDRPGIPPEVVYIFTEDDATGIEPETCFGKLCTDPGGEEQEEGGDGEGEEDDEDDEDDEPGRDIGCVVGPESCEGGDREAPVRTWWVQMNTDEDS